MKNIKIIFAALAFVLTAGATYATNSMTSAPILDCFSTLPVGQDPDVDSQSCLPEGQTFCCYRANGTIINKLP